LTLATGLLLAMPTASTMRGALLVAGVASAVAFGAVERRSRQPIVPRDAWRARGSLGAALAVIGLATFAFFAAETFLPLLVQSGRGRSAIEVGILISAGAVAWTLGALWSGQQTYPRPRHSVILGLGVLLLGTVLLLLAIALLPLPVAYGAWILAGLGMGMIVQNSNVVVLDNARGPQATSITAAGQLALSLGTAAGTALAGLAAQIGFGPNFTPDHVGGAIDGAQLARLERGVSYAIVLAVAASLVAMLVAMRLPHQRQRDDEAAGVGQ
jgi:predicted MFS family arabinose efflux permease